MNPGASGSSIVQLRVREDLHTEAELISLHEWLNHEPELRGKVHTDAHSKPAAGEMGWPVDVLVVSVGSGGAITVLVGSVTTWIRTRRSTLFVEVTKPDGSKLRIDARGPVAVHVSDALLKPATEQGELA
ncbi:effector-associated constant component EACC1 [Nocardia sp. NPDC055049]